MARLAERIVAGSWRFTRLETPKRRPRCRAFGSAEGMRTGVVPQLRVAGGPESWGSGPPVGSHLSAAPLWSGSAGSVVEPRGPDPNRQRQATAAAGGLQVENAATAGGRIPPL